MDQKKAPEHIRCRQKKEERSLTASHVDDTIAQESFDKFRFELIVGVAMTKSSVAAFAPRVELTYKA